MSKLAKLLSLARFGRGIMSPKGSGGHPRNARDYCGRYRTRRLLRLYILTRLTKKEIREILKADNFYPGWFLDVVLA